MRAVDEAVDRLIDDIVEPAKVVALEKLDEGRRAFSIATRWLRGKAAPLSVAKDQESPETTSTRCRDGGAIGRRQLPESAALGANLASGGPLVREVDLGLHFARSVEPRSRSRRPPRRPH